MNRDIVVCSQSWAGVNIDGKIMAFRTHEGILLKKLQFDRKIHRTSTGESFRGKGLPEIKANLDNKSFSHLRVLTNNVFADIAAGQYVNLDYNFSGTFFYFELTEENNSYDYQGYDNIL